MLVDFEPCFIEHDLLNHNKAIILKMDDYYSSRRMHNPPPSIDCLIITKCNDGSYSFYLVELRDVSGTALIKPKEIVPKFETIVHDFFVNKFPDVFISDDVNINKVHMWVVTNALGTEQLTEEEYRAKIKGTVIDQYLSIKPFRIKNRLATIEVVSPRLSSPKPIIKEC
jgi:hypothetical protein